MSNAKKNILLTFGLLLGITSIVSSVQAVCPICTVFIGSGVGVSRWCGIDDIICGVWVGGLIASTIGWTITWFNKINFRFYGRKILTVLFYYGIVIMPFYYTGIIGSPGNKLWGIDKLLLGIVVGTFAFIFAILWHEHLKKKNLGRVYFPFQKVVIPVAVLLLLSFFFYCVTK